MSKHGFNYLEIYYLVLPPSLYTMESGSVKLCYFVIKDLRFWFDTNLILVEMFIKST